MQKVIQRLTTMLTMLGLVCVSLVSFTACSDDDMQPSAIDEKIWDLDGNKDKSYSPGDNFFMYCNGKWWDGADLDGKKRVGLMFDPIFDLRKENISEPRVQEIQRAG